MNADLNDGIQKIRMIKQSLRCLVLGIISLVLPLIGPLFALWAVTDSWAVRRMELTHWNPARFHRVMGMLLAVFAMVIWSTLDLLILFRVLDTVFPNWLY